MNINDEKERIYGIIENIIKERYLFDEVLNSLIAKLDIQTIQPTPTIEPTQEVAEIPVEEEESTKEDKEDKSIVETEHHNMPLTEDVIKNEWFKGNEDLFNELFKKNENKENEIIPKYEIDKQKEYDSKNNIRSRVSVSKAIDTVAMILKESNDSINLNDLRHRLNRRLNCNIKSQNFQANILPKAIKKHPSIKRVRRGYYRYVK